MLPMLKAMAKQVPACRRLLAARDHLQAEVGRLQMERDNLRAERDRFRECCVYLPGHAGAGFAKRPDSSPLLRGISHAELTEVSVAAFLAECENQGVNVILDVGASMGQFATEVRKHGYRGRIVSFEPLSEAHAMLVKNAADDPLWTVAPRVAVGAVSGEVTINVAKNSVSSSILPMLDSHLDAAPYSGYVTQEQVPLTELNSYISKNFSNGAFRFGLKMDTQGYEEEVIRGADQCLVRMQAIFLEISTTPLYEGAPTVDRIFSLLRSFGFGCTGLFPEFVHPQSREILQLNGLFSRVRTALQS